MFTAEARVGRLLEIRMVAPVQAQDVDATRERLHGFFRSYPMRLVCVVDITRASVFTPEVAEKVLQTFRIDNPRLERSGILVTKSAIFSQQLERLIADAGNPARRCFQDPFELKAFLGQLLSRAEHGRLAEFLSGR